MENINFINIEYMNKYLKENVKEVVVDYIDSLARQKIQEAIKEIVEEEKKKFGHILNEELLMNELRKNVVIHDLFLNSVKKIVTQEIKENNKKRI